MALPLANAAHETRYSAVLSNIHPETGWLGRQDSDFCSAPQLGLPLSCGAKSGRRSCLGRFIFRARRSVRHQSFEDSGAHKVQAVYAVRAKGMGVRRIAREAGLAYGVFSAYKQQ
jgi:hypothetical protein